MKKIFFILAIALLSACIVEPNWYAGDFKFVNNSGYNVKLIKHAYRADYNDTAYIENNSYLVIPYDSDDYPSTPFQVDSLTIVFENKTSKTYLWSDTNPRNPLRLEAYTAQKISDTNILFEYTLSVDHM
ncbi:MAG: hypothetical protein RIS47_90 [Bacteroidota bacterium]|jgi:hypothetical protein